MIARSFFIHVRYPLVHSRHKFTDFVANEAQSSSPFNPNGEVVTVHSRFLYSQILCRREHLVLPDIGRLHNTTQAASTRTLSNTRTSPFKVGLYTPECSRPCGANIVPAYHKDRSRDDVWPVILGNVGHSRCHKVVRRS